VRENEPPRSDIVKQVTPLKDGYLQIPETPGIGMELDDAGVARTPFKQRAPNLLIREDGSVALR
jgi:L-alanine-DL-glutamate epimerase-like enolase superfamily enzyme